jgi:hypothetical protein
LDNYLGWNAVVTKLSGVFYYSTQTFGFHNHIPRVPVVERLLSLYENKNEYVDLFYAITHCQGWIKSDKHTVTVRLEPLQQPS